MKKFIPTFKEYLNEAIKPQTPEGQKLIDNYSKYGYKY